MTSHVDMKFNKAAKITLLCFRLYANERHRIMKDNILKS